MILHFSSVYQNKLIFTLYIINKNKKLAYIICTLFLLICLYAFISPEAFEGHLIIISTTYYKRSSLYSNDTAAILFNANYHIKINQKWNCISKDINGKILISKTMPRYAYPIVPNCKWSTFIATCQTVSNPVSIKLSVSKGFKDADLPLRYAMTENLPVVACFSPLFFNERWQLIALSIESYAATGISRQGYYLMSAIKDVYDILQFYESQRLIDINLWTLPTHSEARNELDWRNQGASHTDCFLKYREAAEFIIVADIDDLLFPRMENNFLKELQFFSYMYPNVSSFFYPRFDAEIQATEKFKFFDMKKSLESIKISDRIVTGKSVHKTSLVETVWLHWAGIIKNKKFYTRLDMTSSIFVHVRNWFFVQKYIKPFTTHINSYKTMYPDLTSLTPLNYISQVSKQFEKRLFNCTDLHGITSSDFYYEKINNCYNFMQNSIKEHYKKHDEPAPLCPTPAKCKFTPIHNLSCAVATSTYKTVELANNFYVDLFISKQRVIFSNNGCKIN